MPRRSSPPAWGRPGLQPLVAGAADPGAAAEGVGRLERLRRAGRARRASATGPARASPPPKEIGARDRAFRKVLVLLPGGPEPVDPASPSSPTTRGWTCAPGSPTRTPSTTSSACCAAPTSGRASPGAGRRRAPTAASRRSARRTPTSSSAASRTSRAWSSGCARRRFLAVLGASGSGKSSLVAAGLVPARPAGRAPRRRAWRVLEPGARAPARSPRSPPSSRHLPGAGLARRPPTSPPTSAASTWPRPRARGPPGGRARAGGRRPARGGLHPLPGRGRARGLPRQPRCTRRRSRAGAPSSSSTMRADFYHRLAEHPDAALAGRVAAGAARARSTRAACAGPSRSRPSALRPGARARPDPPHPHRRRRPPRDAPPDGAPAAGGLARRRGRTLTLEAYAASGGVEGALARRANAIYGGDEPRAPGDRPPGAPAPHPARRGHRGHPPPRHPAPSWSPGPGEEAEVDAVVGALAEARLLDDGHRRGHRRARGRGHPRGPHPRLARAARLDQRRPRAAPRRAPPLGRRRRMGRRRPRRGRPLPRRPPRGLGGPRRDRPQRAGAGLPRREPARAERDRQARRKRVKVAIGALAVVVAVIAAIAVFAFVQRNDAADQRDVATSRQLAGSSTLARERDPELATLLAESAYAASPTVEAEESLRQGVHDSTIRRDAPDAGQAGHAPPSRRRRVGSRSAAPRAACSSGIPRGTRTAPLRTPSASGRRASAPARCVRPGAS